MSEPAAGRRRVVLRSLSWAASVLVLWVVVFDGRLPTALAPEVERTLYFKLPIEGARFHWQFQDRDAFLAGELTLRIINKDRDQTLVVFRDGTIHDGWRMIGDARRDGAFYFGFTTDDRIRTAPNDSLVLTLTVADDLPGRGPHREGVLPAGTWEATGTYSALYGGSWNPVHFLVLRGDPPVAYLQCWDDVWPIHVTKTEGWNGSKPEDDRASTFLRRVWPERGVDGRRCGSHI